MALCCVARHATRPFRFATSLAPYGHYYSTALARFFVFFIYRSHISTKVRLVYIVKYFVLLNLKYREKYLYTSVFSHHYVTLF